MLPIVLSSLRKILTNVMDYLSFAILNGTKSFLLVDYEVYNERTIAMELLQGRNDKWERTNSDAIEDTLVMLK